MDDQYSFRTVAAGDKAAWKALWKDYQVFYEVDFEDQVSETTWSRLIDDNQPDMGALVAETQDGRIIGFLNFVLHNITWSVPQVCYLEDLFVVPDARGGGVARGLIEKLIDLGRAAGWHRIYWHTARDNVPAQVLYNKIAERTGWVRYDLDLED